MIAFMAGLGLTLVILFVIFGIVVACSGLIGILRAALNPELGSFGKIFWILACFVPGMAFLYFAFIDKNGFLRFVGWVCLIAIVLTAVFGGVTLDRTFESFRNSAPVQMQIVPPEPSEDGGGDLLDDSISL